MKTALFLLSIIPSLAWCQITVVNRVLADTTKHQLYCNIDNEISLSVPKSSGTILLKANTASITRQEGNNFLVRVYKPGKDTLRVYSRDILVYQWPFVADTIPAPLIQIGNYTDTILTIQHILAQPTVTVNFPLANWNHQWSISRFKTIFHRIDEEGMAEESGYANRFTEKQLRLVQQLQPGDSIEFKDIYGGSPGSRSTKFPSFSVYIR